MHIWSRIEVEFVYFCIRSEKRLTEKSTKMEIPWQSNAYRSKAVWIQIILKVDVCIDCKASSTNEIWKLSICFGNNAPVTIQAIMRCLCAAITLKCAHYYFESRPMCFKVTISIEANRLCVKHQNELDAIFGTCLEYASFNIDRFTVCLTAKRCKMEAAANANGISK